MLSSKSLRRRRKDELRQQNVKPALTHTEIMRRRGSHRSLKAPGDIEKYKGGTRIPITKNESYCAYTFNLPGSNSTGEYRVTSGTQTVVVLDGVIFVNKVSKKNPENVILRSDDAITFTKGDVVSFCPNTAPMNGLLIESGDFKTKKKSDPIANTTGVEQYQVAHDKDAPEVVPRMQLRKPKSKEERERMGAAFLAAKGRTPDKDVPAAAPEVPTKAAATTVEGVNPTPMGDTEDE
jgi:hypothetical protein